tara:strand:- start:293 stop:940 length:648 start_codon:yes stop_codon:yes gene_type:complete
MSDLIKAVFESLSKGIPAWLRGSILTLTVVLAFMHFSGFTYDNYVIAQKLADLKHESILMSYRSSLDEDRYANRIVEEVHSITGSYGVALFSLEPEYIPKVVSVLSRDGDHRFEQYVKVGQQIHISSRLPAAWMHLREGLVHEENLNDRHQLFKIGIKSCIAHPVVYKGLTIGVLGLFLDKSFDEYTATQIEEFNGELRLACNKIAEEFYYSRNK